MNNIEKYKKVFVDSFEMDDSSNVGTLEYNTIPKWDSIGHMSLISELEDVFDIMMETDDVIEFGSFEKGKEILKKYGVEIS